jgi:hypothetical protein
MVPRPGGRRNSYCVTGIPLHDITTADRPTTMKRIYDPLKNSEKLLLREPTSASHGTPADEMCALGRAAGLRQGSGVARSTFMIGAHFGGVCQVP